MPHQEVPTSIKNRTQRLIFLLPEKKGMQSSLPAISSEQTTCQEGGCSLLFSAHSNPIRLTQKFLQLHETGLLSVAAKYSLPAVTSKSHTTNGNLYSIMEKWSTRISHLLVWGTLTLLHFSSQELLSFGLKPGYNELIQLRINGWSFATIGQG